MGSWRSGLEGHSQSLVWTGLAFWLQIRWTWSCMRGTCSCWPWAGRTSDTERPPGCAGSRTEACWSSWRTSGTDWGWTAPSQSGSWSPAREPSHPRADPPPPLSQPAPRNPSAEHTNNTQILYRELLLRLEDSQDLITGENDSLACSTRPIASLCSKGERYVEVRMERTQA